MKTRLISLIVLSTSIRVSFSQGTFQNLDFEAANVAGTQINSLVPTASAFPGWQTFEGTTEISSVVYDGISTGAFEISIVDTKGGLPIQGNYSAYLFSSLGTTTTLSQTGLVPAGTESIQMDAYEALGSFTVTLAGQTVNLVPLQTFPNFTLYGGNISAWSGDNAALSITENLPTNPGIYPDELELDNITFSTQVIPEPAPVVLTGIGGLLFALYRRFAPKRQ